MVQNGPDSTRVRSTTRNPSSGRMRFLPHFAAKEIPGKQIGVHDGFLRLVHASFQGVGVRSAAYLKEFNSNSALHQAWDQVCISNNGKAVPAFTWGGRG